MFPLFRRDGQQPSNQGSASESVPRVDNSPENSPPGAAKLEQPVVAGEGQQGAAESLDGLEQGAAEQPVSEETTAASCESVVGPEGVAQGPSSEPYEAAMPLPPRRRGRSRGRRLASPQEQAAPSRPSFTAEQRLLLLDTWQRSGLPAGDFATLVGVSAATLYKWKKLFQEHGPAGLMEQPRGARTGSRLPEVTKRTILMLKEQHPEWGCQRISDMLVRGPGLPASASAVARVLKEAGYELLEQPTRPHRSQPTRFERARPNQLWQTDLFTFVLKRQNRRVYLVAFMDDHSRFIASYGLHASASTALVLEVLEAGISAWGPPEEILTDNGPQYVTWRGKSRFTRHLEKRGIKQIVARPRRPQTLGKIERFWGTLWREFLETTVFQDLADARTRMGHFLDYYNLQRCHSGIDGLVPADRFFGAAPDVLRTLKERARANALQLARHGQAKAPFYVTGQMDGQAFSVHAEGERLVLKKQGQQRQEIELAGPSSKEKPESEEGGRSSLPEALCPRREPDDDAGEPAVLDPPAPGHSALEEGQLRETLDQGGQPPVQPGVDAEEATDVEPPSDEQGGAS
jgi:transposase InsO family protein